MRARSTRQVTPSPIPQNVSAASSSPDGNGKRPGSGKRRQISAAAAHIDATTTAGLVAASARDVTTAQRKTSRNRNASGLAASVSARKSANHTSRPRASASSAASEKASPSPYGNAAV